jgi:drug/metabolite transporter (DMT)-like permease
MQQRPPPAQIVLAFAGIYVIWGTTFFAIALVIRTVPPFLSGAVRFALAGGLMYLWLRTRRTRPLAGLHVAGGILCGVLLTGMGNGFVIWAQQGLPSGVAALFVGAMPVSVLLMDWLFFARRAPRPQAVLGCALGLAGVIVLALYTQSLAGNARPIYIASVLLAQLAWALGTMLQRRFVRADQVVAYSCLQMLSGAVWQGLMGVLDREWVGFSLTQVSLLSLLALLYLVVIGSLVAVNCYSFLVAHVPPQEVTTYALVNPVIALLLGTLVLHEHFSRAALVATVLVIAGVALVLYQGSAPRSPRPSALAAEPPGSG